MQLTAKDRRPAIIPLQDHVRRRIILAMLFASTWLNYFDRQTLSILKPIIKSDFRLDDNGYANIVSGFLISYVVAYALSGYVVDRIGARKAMTLFVGTWSIASLLTFWSRRFNQLLASSTLLGAAEPGNYPAALSAATEWFPAESRGAACSIYQAGGITAAILAFPIVAWIAARWGWRTAFAFPGILGLAWALLWWMIYCAPSDLSDAVDANRDTAQEPWARLFQKRTLWAIVLGRTVTDQAWYFCMFWMPGYFEEKLHLTLKQSGMIGWIPFFIAALAAVASGYFSDILVRRGLPPWRSRLFILIGAACLTPLAIAIPSISSNVIVIVLFSVFAAVCQIWLFNLTTLVADTFPKTEVASVLGISGSFGALGGLLSTKIIGTAIGSVGYNSIFVVMGSLHLVGALFLYGLINRSSLR